MLSGKHTRVFALYPFAKVFLGVPIPSSKAMSSAIADLSCAVVAQLASYED